MKERLVILSVVGAAIAMALTGITESGASDHADGPQMLVDKASDITDLDTFMRPEDDGSGGFRPSSHLVLVATFDPGQLQDCPSRGSPISFGFVV